MIKRWRNVAQPPKPMPASERLIRGQAMIDLADPGLIEAFREASRAFKRDPELQPFALATDSMADALAKMAELGGVLVTIASQQVRDEETAKLWKAMHTSMAPEKTNDQ